MGEWDAHQSVLWARAARQGDPTTRPTFSQSHACYENYMEAMACSYGVQLIAAVAAYSWLQSRHAVGNYAVASYAARGMSGRAVAACSCVLRRAPLAPEKLALALVHPVRRIRKAIFP